MNKLWIGLLLVLLSACSTPKKGVLTIQASSMPQSELLQLIQEDLQKEGITLEILVIDDYNLPNRALAEGTIAANFFQHKPFLQEQIDQFHYELSPLVEVHIEPMGLYSSKETLSSIPDRGVITIPNDPTNETRALLLLEAGGLISLQKKQGPLCVLDILENKKELRFQEIDAALLTRTLSEVDGAVIPTNYALLQNLSPKKHALLVEDNASLYANVIVVRTQDLLKPELIALKRHMNSEKIRQYIESKYEGNVVLAH